MKARNEILTLNETCSYLRVSRPTLVKLLKSGEIKSFKVGRRVWKISRSDLEDYINTNRRQ